ncbi:MAG TPA: D-alanine--D-alanine ligase family protein, partial [Limnochordia bacterium]|nr:D-alanine--D-alanine ligase family protein [Limnochordia bacterium]
MSRKLRVGVLFGGRSGEHEVSLMSAASVIKAIDRSQYEIVPIGIAKDGRWLIGGDPLATLSLGEVTDSDCAVLPPHPAANAVLSYDAAQPNRFKSERVPLDVVFPVLHGPMGEDGTVQGLLELAELPYVGSGVLGSAVGMDKVAMKAVFRDAGLDVVDQVVAYRREVERELDALVARVGERLGYPCFVKPANMGSSVGITKAHDAGELPAALREAARYDRKILIEAAAQDCREIECAILGNDDPEASVLGEILPAGEFYDYHSKYFDDRSGLVIPADLDPATTKRVQEAAVRAFRAVDGAGLARVDF